MICSKNKNNNSNKAKKSKNKVLRYPRLDTVMMVEKTIKKYDGEFKKRALWEHLPKKMMYQTFCVVIDYLYPSKVSIDAEGKIGWIYYPRSARRWYNMKHLAWKKEYAGL